MILIITNYNRKSNTWIDEDSRVGSDLDRRVVRKTCMTGIH